PREEDDGEAGRGVEVHGGELQRGEPVRDRVADRGHAPDHDREREAAPGPQLVHDPPREEEADRVGQLEGEDDGRLDALVGPAELLDEGRLQDADDLAVDVVDRGREEEQRADHPAAEADARPRRLPAIVHWLTPLARKPPSTHSTSPFTKLADSEARK